MALIRSFVGISLEVAVAAQISSALAPIKAANQEQSIRWVPTENWHVTLAFLGDQAEETLARLPETLAASLCDITEFDVSLSCIDMFPDAHSRIVAAWVAPSPELDLLYQRIYQAVDSMGIAMDTQAFLPHITLGRIRKGHSALVSAQPMNSVLRVQQVTLFSSQRTPQGSVYTPMSLVSLTG